jgi:hypothetical protein
MFTEALHAAGSWIALWLAAAWKLAEPALGGAVEAEWNRCFMMESLQKKRAISYKVQATHKLYTLHEEGQCVIPSLTFRAYKGLL